MCNRRAAHILYSSDVEADQGREHFSMMRRAALWCLGFVLGGAPQLAFADAYLDASRVATELETQGRLDAAAEALEAIAPSYPQDLDLALKYFIDAANEEVAEAHFNCGRWYEYVGKNISLARQHYEKAEKLGSERAKEALWQTQKVRKKRSPFNPLRK